MTYQTLSTQPRVFLAMTGLTTAEFGDLLSAFETAYERAYPRDRTATGQRRHWWRVGRDVARGQTGAGARRWIPLAVSGSMSVRIKKSLTAV